MEKSSKKNHLQHEKSLYLQQHAGNPIDWYPWGTEAFQKAQKENKLMLISIGYSSCHWCHVMEHEVFENETAAAYLNEHFVCIKVDREERPDIDNTYMLAVQLMTNSGGWPLNCFTLSNGKPVYGGTYFPLPHFMKVIEALQKLQKEDPKALEEAAKNIKEGLTMSIKVDKPENLNFEERKLEVLVHNWSLSFDLKYGGRKGAPKFPMPNNYEFLLQYGQTHQRKEITDFVHATLHHIVRGGIYDHLEGGLMRYSTDEYWKEPHFEKMLYDNAQFLTCLAKAYQNNPDDEYAFVISQTIAWLDKKMQTAEGFYKSSVDADAAGEEGSYYVWTKPEVEKIFGNDAHKVEDLYQMNTLGFWKEGKYILLRENGFKDFAEQHSIEEKAFLPWLQTVNDKLISHREKRIPPVIDEKVVFSWNCMLAIAFAEAGISLKNPEYLKKAETLTLALEKKYIHKDRICRIVNDPHRIVGFLDDYAYYIKLCICLHQLTLEEQWLEKAKTFLNVVEDIFDEEEGLFYYSEKDPLLLADTIEQNDNVIPASNSVLAHCFWDVGVICSENSWLEKAKSMLATVYQPMERYGSSYSNWAMLLQKVLIGDLLLSYFSPVTMEEHHQYLRENPDFVLFNKELRETTPEVFQICHNGSCALPEFGFSKISKQLHEALKSK